MKKILLIIPFILASALSCKKENSVEIKSKVICTKDFTNYPKHQQLQNLIDKYTQRGFVGISLLVEHPTWGIWQGASGFASIEKGIKMTPCHLVQSASISKTYIAVMIMQLIELNYIKLDDHLDNWIDPEILDRIPNGHTVNIRQLLQHRSGIPDIFEVDFMLDFFNQPLKVRSLEELLSYLNDVPALSKPGNSYYYSDGNYALLSLILEKKYGTVNQAFVTQIFEKAQMTNASLINNPKEPPSGLVENYWDRYSNGIIENVSSWQLALCAASTGKGTDALVTNVEDMNKFLRALNNGTLINQTSLQLMKEVIDIPAEQQKQGFVAYGLGLGKVKLTYHEWYGHFGNHIGSGAIALYNPDQNISIVVYENTGTFFNDEMKKKFFGELIVELESIIF